MGEQVLKTRATFRSQEMDWIESHLEELRQLEGNWIVVEGDQLIAYGYNRSEVVKQAKEKGIAIPFIFFIPHPQDGIFMGI